MKVCHLTSAHPNNDIRIFVKECCSLADAGLTVHLVAPRASKNNDSKVLLHPLDVMGNSRLRRMTHTVRDVFIKAQMVDADIYHFHDPELIPVGLRLSSLGKTVIYDIHEDLPRDIRGKEYLGPARWMLSRPFELVENFAARKFSALVAATPAIGERFQKINSNTIVLNNYPLLSEFKEPLIPWERRSNTIVYVGVISKARGIAEVIQAITMIPEGLKAKIEIAGKFRLPQERDELVGTPGWKFVEEHGILDRCGVASLLSRSKVGMVTLHPQPQFLVSQPIKLYEYMAAGIPIIASDFPAWRKIIEMEGCGLLVDPSDSNAIAQAISYLLSHPNEAKEMGKRGKDAVVRQYNWENEFQKLLYLYHNLTRK